MVEFLQTIIQVVQDLFSLIPMPWRVIIFLLLSIPVLSWLMLRGVPWFLAKFSQIFFICSEFFAKLLLFPEFLVSRHKRKQNHKSPDINYILGDVLGGIVSILYEISLKLDKVEQYAFKKRWSPRRCKLWLFIVGLILSFLWYFRPIFGATTVGKLIDSGSMGLYSFDRWFLNKQSTSNAVNSGYSLSPEQFIKAYYSAINNRNYPEAWSCLSEEVQINQSKNMSGNFISYVSDWEGVEQVEINKIRLEKQNENSAVVVVNIQLQYFGKKNENTYKLQSVRSWLSRDSQNRKWVINGSKILAGGN